MAEPQALDFQALKELTKRFRLDVLDMTAKVGGHVSSCFSAVEILTAVYFGGVLRYRPDDPAWPGRDRFILSKGHAAPAFYSVLAHAGYFPVAELKHFRQLDYGLHGHPIGGTLPGVEMTGGSLGQGLSFGLGHVLAGRLSRLDYRVYVLLGDGECEEGQIWEAAMAAAHWKADRLTAIIDHNKYQQTGPISREMSLAPFADKWRSFGWHAEEVDGHDVVALIETLRKVSPPLKSGESRSREAAHGPGPALSEVEGVGAAQPSVIIAHTVKGKGVSFVERDYGFHGRSLSPEQDAQAREEILCNQVKGRV